MNGHEGGLGVRKEEEVNLAGGVDGFEGRKRGLDLLRAISTRCK